MNTTIAGSELAEVVKGLENIKQRAEFQLQELAEQRQAREAAERDKAVKEGAKVTSRRTDAERQAQIESISGDLNTSLRLSRIDAAIKELLAFMEDDEFYAANATTGRKRRLRSLQNAISKALE
jgi:hypothetical protein